MNRPIDGLTCVHGPEAGCRALDACAPDDGDAPDVSLWPHLPAMLPFHEAQGALHACAIRAVTRALARTRRYPEDGGDAPLCRVWFTGAALAPGAAPAPRAA